MADINALLWKVAKMIDPLSEQVLSLTKAARSCPERRGGKKPHVSCLSRWTTAGCKGVVLESIQIGGTRCTSRQALARFFHRLTALTDCDGASLRTPCQRERDIRVSEKELDRARI